MSDDADKAQDHEAEFRAKSLAKAKQADGPAPVIIDGVICCAECGVEIPAQRVAARPGVGLCLACQQEVEDEQGLTP